MNSQRGDFVNDSEFNSRFGLEGYTLSKDEHENLAFPYGSRFDFSEALINDSVVVPGVLVSAHEETCCSDGYDCRIRSDKLSVLGEIVVHWDAWPSPNFGGVVHAIRDLFDATVSYQRIMVPVCCSEL